MISVCMIVWNEEEYLPHAVNSTRELADEVVVVDTGSTDRTVEIAQELGCKVITGVDRWHKGAARNISIEHAGGDWVVILDADEQIADPYCLRLFLMEETTAQAVYVKSMYLVDEKPVMWFYQLRCWRRGEYTYKYHAHEVPIGPYTNVVHTGFIFEHRQPPGRTWKLLDTLRRLEMDVKEHPDDPRPHYYLGRQYRYLGRYQDAIIALKRYFEKPDHDEPNAHYDIAQCYKALGNTSEFVKEMYLAIATAPQRRDFWGELAEYYHDIGQHTEAIAMLRAMFELQRPEHGYVVERWYGAHAYDLMARCLWYAGRRREGKPYAQRACKLDPTNERLSKNLKWFLSLE